MLPSSGPYLRRISDRSHTITIASKPARATTTQIQPGTTISGSGASGTGVAVGVGVGVGEGVGVAVGAGVGVGVGDGVAVGVGVGVGSGVGVAVGTGVGVGVGVGVDGRLRRRSRRLCRRGRSCRRRYGRRRGQWAYSHPCVSGQLPGRCGRCSGEAPRKT